MTTCDHQALMKLYGRCSLWPRALEVADLNGKTHGETLGSHGACLCLLVGLFHYAAYWTET